MVREFVRIKMSDLKRCLDWSEETIGKERRDKYGAPDDDTVVVFTSSCCGNSKDATTALFRKIPGGHTANAFYNNETKELLIQ